jgi:hypothetical protein
MSEQKVLSSLIGNLFVDRRDWVAEHAVFRPRRNFPSVVLFPGEEV